MLSNNSRIMRTTNTRFENFWLGAARWMLVSNVLFFGFCSKRTDSSRGWALLHGDQFNIEDQCCVGGGIAPG